MVDVLSGARAVGVPSELNTASGLVKAVLTAELHEEQENCEFVV